MYLLTEYRETTLFLKKFNAFWQRDLLLPSETGAGAQPQALTWLSVHRLE